MSVRTAIRLAALGSLGSFVLAPAAPAVPAPATAAVVAWQGDLGEPAASSQVIRRTCDRVITRTVVTDREGDVLKRKRVVRFRDPDRC